MAVANANLGGVDPASTACKAPPVPSGMMIGPSTTQCYIRPMQLQMLPTGYQQNAQNGPQGYGYYNPNNQGFIGSSGIFGYCQGGQHYGMEAGQALHCGTPMPYMYQRPQNQGNVYAGQQAANQCQYNAQNQQAYQNVQAHPNCAAAYRDMVKQQNAGFQSDPSKGITQTPYVQLGSSTYWAGQPGKQLSSGPLGSPRQATACPGGGRCFAGLATSPVNACGYDAGGVPVTINALNQYNSPASVAQNSMANWGNELRAPNPASTLQCAQWLGLEGSTRGLCLLAALTNELPGGLCVSYQGSGGSNSPGGNFFSVPCGCTVTFSHEMQEMLNPNEGPGASGAYQDNSDVRYNTPGTPAHCNNFKSCGVGYSCFDSALTAFFGTNYCTAPNAWQFAKTPSYQGGALLPPGGGGPGSPQPCGGHCVIGPGGIVIHLPGPAQIPQAAAAHSDTCAGPGHRKKPNDPGELGMKPFAYGGPVQGYAGGGGVMTDPFACFPRQRPVVGACPNPQPQPNPHPQPAPKPICIHICTPKPPDPTVPNIVPFQSASPAYPYRGIVCTGQITYPGFETWNFPLGTPETPGGPGIPTPPKCGPKPCHTGGTCIIPITNIPGVSGIQPDGNGGFIYLGPDGKPLQHPGCTGVPQPQPNPQPQPQPCGGGCNPCNPQPCNPQPCNPCNPCGPKPCGPPAPCKSPFGTVSPFMPCYMGVSPWPSPQNVWGGDLPQTPWLPGGKVCNGLGPSPAMPASPAYGLAPQACAAFHGPHIPGPVMPFASPASTTTSTGLCTSHHPSFGSWEQNEDQQLGSHNFTPGGNCAYGYLANLQAGNIAFPTMTHVTNNPGVAPVTPGEGGNLYAYPGSDKWTGTSSNPYIHGCGSPAPVPGGPGCNGGGDGDNDWDDNMALGAQHNGHGGNNGQPGMGSFSQCGNFTGSACFGGQHWGNTGTFGGWGSPASDTAHEDPAEAWAQQNWCQLWSADAAKQQGLHPGTGSTTTQTGIPCWHPPDWNAPNNPGYTNTSNPGQPGGMPTWPGQANTGTGHPGASTGGYNAQATPFLNGDLYQPGFETVGAGFQGNPWQPQCLSQVNPGAISMGLAGFQLPAPATPAQAPGSVASGGQHHARGGTIVPGTPEVAGDSEKNDKVKALLSPGEIVIPRSVALDPNAPAKAAAFVAAVRARKSPAEALRRAHG